jgi:hypothetical protein
LSSIPASKAAIQPASSRFNSEKSELSEPISLFPAACIQLYLVVTKLDTASPGVYQLSHPIPYRISVTASSLPSEKSKLPAVAQVAPVVAVFPVANEYFPSYSEVRKEESAMSRFVHTPASKGFLRSGMPLKMRWVLILANGRNTLDDFVRIVGRPPAEINKCLGQLMDMGLVEVVSLSAR